MSRFYCCFIGDDDRVMDYETLVAATEQDAARRAGLMLYARPSAAAAELWRAGKFITLVSPIRYPLVHDGSRHMR
jgi:hypothetical protein